MDEKIFTKICSVGFLGLIGFILIMSWSRMDFMEKLYATFSISCDVRMRPFICGGKFLICGLKLSSRIQVKALGVLNFHLQTPVQGGFRLHLKAP